jgi:hypothetical protein
VKREKTLCVPKSSLGWSPTKFNMVGKNLHFFNTVREGIEIPRLDLTKELNLEHGDFEICYFTCKTLLTWVVGRKGGTGDGGGRKDRG